MLKRQSDDIAMVQAATKSLAQLQPQPVDQFHIFGP
jgi:hypothetical protein